MRVRTIRSTLIGAFSVVIATGILVLGGLSLLLFQKSLLDETRRSNVQLIGQLNRILDGYVGYMKDLAQVVWQNPDVGAYVAAPGGGSAEQREKVRRFLAGVPQIRPDIDSLVLFRPGSDVVTSAPNRALNPWLDRGAIPWYRQSPAAPNGATVSAARIENLFDDRYQWVISVALAQPGTGQAWLQVDLNYQVIEELCRHIQLGGSGYVFIVDSRGDLVYHPRQQLVYSGLKNEQIDAVLRTGQGQLEARVDQRDLIYTVATSTNTGWTVVAVSYLDELLASAGGLEAVILSVVLGCLLFTSFLAWRLSLQISRPIESLRRSMKAVETGDFDVVIDVDSPNEVGELARDCDIAIRQVRDLMRQALVDQEAKRRQDILMLQSQINPHFLYNTLDSIIWMVELNRSEEAIRMTSTLAKFFRLGITRGSHLLSLRHELDHVGSYLAIQKMRYGAKLDFDVAVDPSVLDTPVLKLSLQPLVENALYHGIKEREGPGKITIRGGRVGGRVEVEVADDGVGMAPEVVAGLLTARGEPGEHLGLWNVHERLRLQFGEPCGLRFASTLGEGTVVTVVLPEAAP